MSRLFLTVDGGGTKTECLLFTKRGQVLASALAPDANANFTSRENAAASVGGAVSSCLERAGATVSDIERATLFVPGFAPCVPLLRARLGDMPVSHLGDELNAFYGALGSPPGIVVLAGTGSFAFGIREDGERATAGGWGSLFGDEGSGYAIGAMSLHRVAERYDRRLPPDLLTSLTLESLGLQSPEELREAMYRPGVTRRVVADLCRVTARAAEMGDAEALSVLGEATDALAGLAAIVHARLGGGTMRVSLIGGVSRIGEHIERPFVGALSRRSPAMAFAPALYSPIIGGMLYTLAQAGVDTTEEAVRENARAYERSRSGGKR